MLDHWFWLGLSLACIMWYSTVTVYVTVKGFADIKSMFTELTRQKDEPDPIDAE